MTRLFSGVYKGKTVLVTGHTGFKGSWLVYWLNQLGANVIGYSLEAPTVPNHISLLNFEIISIIGDIRDLLLLNDIVEKYQPDIVFHLAAQSLVRPSYEDPIETYEANVLGTLKVFEACRKHHVKVVVNITSDKVYKNKSWVWGYRENDMLGGYDPYSASKSCAEILTASYRDSYFNLSDYRIKHNTLLASCRAGNVIGGGDWAKDRLLPDIMIAAGNAKQVKIRNPNAIRPWQHVLESLSGYLCIGQKLLQGEVDFSNVWNFGPNYEENVTVTAVVEHIGKYWDKVDYEIDKDNNQPHEARFLKLDCSKAHTLLKWKAVWNSEVAFERTVKWYQAYYERKNIILTKNDLEAYIAAAEKKGLPWAKS